MLIVKNWTADEAAGKLSLLEAISQKLVNSNNQLKEDKNNSNSNSNSNSNPNDNKQSGSQLLTCKLIGVIYIYISIFILNPILILVSQGVIVTSERL